MPISPGPLLDEVRAWQAVDPDADTRGELDALIDAGDTEALAERFAGRLQFGTAGLRAALGAGPMRMNRVVVRRAAWGLVRYLLETDPDAANRGLVIGFDARRNSDVFAGDTARVAAALGVRSRVLPGPLPTPVLAYSVVGLDAAAGVMVTASHNPPQDNGYKVYLGDGAQIVPPHDTGISERIAQAPDDVPVAADGDPLIETLDATAFEPYLDAIHRVAPEDAGVAVAYTPMHGVGGELLLAAFERAGLRAPAIVEAQFRPDPSFPTVSFPNPEEPGAMDLVLELAASTGADIAIANDPDADRLGAAIPTPEGGWRRLTGDEIGWLLADHILATTTGDDRLVVTTLVSSSLLAEMAAHHGVHYAETYTGFKWIGRTILDHPGLRFVFGYEQALGYLVAPLPLDKDGISAAVVMAEVAGRAKREGVSLQQRLDAIAARFGRHVTAERSLRMEPAAGVALVERLRADPPAEVGGTAVTATNWYDEAGLLRLQLGDAVRLQIRPSGTEPKVKLYAEAVDADPTALLDALAASLT
jgi:phosphomannomutase